MLTGVLVVSLVVLHGFTSGEASDPRVISYDDLLMSGSYFSEPGVSNYTTMLFDVSRNQIIIGARDNLFRVSLRGLDKLERSPCLAPAEKVKLCQNKGQSEDDCHNYIKVLETDGKRLFACGTNAFFPQCSWREMDEVNRVTDWTPGIAKCPYNPRANVTSHLSLSTGHLYAATTVDFSGSDSAIIRSNLSNPMAILRTPQSNLNMLNEPQFVATFETEFYVYFLFRESAVEFINCGKIIYSRIARVCKNDNGGNVFLKDNWTTFVKARLNCSLPGEYPFYYDNIQGATYLPDQGILYATFTTPENSIPGSAICAYNMTAIEAAFKGPYKHQSNTNSAWERKSIKSQHGGSCSGNQTVLDSSRYQLMDSAVQPVSIEPLYHSKLETLTHIAVNTVSTKIHQAVHILYVATTDRLVKKISVMQRTQKTCTLEIWKPVPVTSVGTKIHMLQFAIDSLYISTDEGVLRVSSQHCRRYKSRTACLASMDPHCGWHEHMELCVPAPDRNPLTIAWQQDATRCPTLNHPVDGGWSAWSPYSTCEQPNGDGCFCSTRSCNNPAPMNGGNGCLGVSVRVANCTVHGGWTPWSVWSACSQSCGRAVRTRTRVCGNPSPQFGGRVCVGQDRTEMFCHNIPPCPVVTVPSRDGEWSQWGTWGECSTKCGGGFRLRTRTCTNPPPQLPGGLDCPGCPIEYQICNTNACIDSKRLSSWTQWAPSGNGSEKRLRFSCRAPVPDPSMIKISLFKTDERICGRDGVCTRPDRPDDEEVWSEWSPWSPCSADCGNGQQSRIRSCDRSQGDCHGPSQMTRACNSHPCKGEWGCWSDWTPCTASCGPGIKQRSRQCLGGDRTSCVGKSTDQDYCNLTPCLSLEGWEEWSVWSNCNSEGQQTRTRTCLVTSHEHNLCQGPDTDYRVCVDAVVETQTAGFGIGTAVGCLIIGFLIGTAASIILRRFLDRRTTNRIPTSPHYISSKQNPYVTVPLKETPHASPKRTPSFSRQNSNGTSRLFKGSTSNGNGVEYETATIKRNSHSLLNGNIRTDLTEQDKFF